MATRRQHLALKVASLLPFTGRLICHSRRCRSESIMTCIYHHFYTKKRKEYALGIRNTEWKVCDSFFAKYRWPDMVFVSNLIF